MCPLRSWQKQQKDEGAPQRTSYPRTFHCCASDTLCGLWDVTESCLRHVLIGG
jgi:hypothetical protein